MKIIKYGDPITVDLHHLNNKIGCPCCGENKRSVEYGTMWFCRGIRKSAKPRIYKTGIFKRKTWQVDICYCATCGCEWEGDPYEIDPIYNY